ncbi:MAG: type IV secretion system DNA-binding domain-containing protein [Rhodocyclaceae bacterium]|nr:type IV secretion system DNA-binding domain-containing protein [Rhodocyclaceae bacterium]
MPFDLYASLYEALTQYILPAAAGAALRVFLVIWRKLSSRWATWFPLLKGLTEYVLWFAAAGIAAAIAAVLYMANQIGVAVLCIAMGFAITWVLAELLAGQEEEVVERGARVAEDRVVASMTRKGAPPVPIVFGGVSLPADAEPYHLLVAGSTGSGKSVAIKGVLDALRARGDTAIIVDSGGEFAARYWDAKKDFLLNPFDQRCIAWSPMSELSGVWDADALAKSIVPDGTGESKEWNGYAQTLVASVMRALLTRGDLTLKSMLTAIQSMPMSELAIMLKGTPAAAQLESDKTFGSIRTIASNYLSTFNYLADEPSDFSVARFVRESRGGFLYLTYRDDQLDSLRNLISFVLDVASRTILSMEPDKNRRVWLIIDEFSSIGKVQSIEAIATKARKVGGCLLVGLQSISQLKDRYGENGAQSILSCLSSWLVLRCADGDTAEYVSRYLGEEQVRQRLAGSSTADSGKSVSISTTVQTRRVVMASQIQAMPDLRGYLRVTGGYPICEIKLSFPKKIENVTRSFEARDFSIRKMVDISAQKEERAEHGVPQRQAMPEASLAESYSDRVARLRVEYEDELMGNASPEKLDRILAQLDSVVAAMR